MARPRGHQVELSACVSERHSGLLGSWLRRPHVSEWWGDPDKTLLEVSRPPSAGGEALIAVDIDVAIGEVDWIGRGVGSRALELLAEKASRGRRGRSAWLDLNPRRQRAGTLSYTHPHAPERGSRARRNSGCWHGGVVVTDLGFSYRTTKGGVVHISRHGQDVATLRAGSAARFISRAEGASDEAVQQLCARATGNYRRGNEAHAATVRKAKGRGA